MAHCGMNGETNSQITGHNSFQGEFLSITFDPEKIQRLTQTKS